MKTQNNILGFTLLEVLVSIFLLSLMAFSIIKITSQSTTTKMEVISEDKDVLRVYSALYTIQWDFNHFYSPLFQQTRLQVQKLKPTEQESDEKKTTFTEFSTRLTTQFQNNKRFSGYSDDGNLIAKILKESNESITFLSNGYRRKNLNEHTSNFAWITYALEEPTSEDIEYLKEVEKKPDVKAGKNLVRYIDAKNPFSPEPTSKDDLYPQVLMEKIISMQSKLWETKKKSFSLLENLTDDQQPISTFLVKITYLDLYDQEQIIEKMLPTNYSEKSLQKVTTQNADPKAATPTEGEYE